MLTNKKAIVTGGSRGIAALAAFLGSDQASYITGSTIDIDGGFSI